MGAHFDYWLECVSQAAEECDATLTQEQLECIANAVQGSHENYGMAFYQPPINEHPIFSENKSLKAQLERERNKVHCKVCNGKGRVYTSGPYHGSDSQCWKCNGEGRHSP